MRRQHVFPLLVVAATLTLAGQISGLVAAGVSRSNGQETLVGEELADSLGLDPVTNFPVIGCQYFAEVSDGNGYCLDGRVSSDAEAGVMWLRLRGYEPTAEDRNVFELGEEFERLVERSEFDPDAEARSVEVGERFRREWAQLSARLDAAGL